MKNKTESKLSRKGVFGSLWRWVKGKIASSCKLSLSISSNISDEKKKKKIDELVKKIEGWDTSYYPGDRIKAILTLADVRIENNKSTKITWDDLDDNQKGIVQTKLVGFLNRICYGDYTGGPSSNSKRENFIKDIYGNHKKHAILKNISFEWFTTCKEIEKDNSLSIYEEYEKTKKITNISSAPFLDNLKSHFWCCLTETKNNKYEDGMNGDYFRLLLKYARPDAYSLDNSNQELSSLGTQVSLYQDMENLINDKKIISNEELLKIDRYNNRKTYTREAMLDDLTTIHFAITGNSYYPAESYLRMGITLLKYLKVNETIYENKNLKSLKGTSLEDAPLILLLLDWSRPQFKNNGLNKLEIKIIKKGKNFVIMCGKFSGFSKYYLFYVDKKDNKLKYITDHGSFGIKQKAEKISTRPDECKQALKDEKLN